MGFVFGSGEEPCESFEAAADDRFFLAAMRFDCRRLLLFRPEADLVSDRRREWENTDQKGVFSGLVMCVASRSDPCVFRAANSVSIFQRVR